jgi:hypothetical protein
MVCFASDADDDEEGGEVVRSWPANLGGRAIVLLFAWLNWWCLVWSGMKA